MSTKARHEFYEDYLMASTLEEKEALLESRFSHVSFLLYVFLRVHNTEEIPTNWRNTWAYARHHRELPNRYP